jgi:hypothetical protein
VPTPANHLEDGNPILIAGDRVTINKARRQSRRRPSDEREADSEIVALAGEEAHSVGGSFCENAKAVVLDFVYQQAAASRRASSPRQRGLASKRPKM